MNIFHSNEYGDLKKRFLMSSSSPFEQTSECKLTEISQQQYACKSNNILRKVWLERLSLNNKSLGHRLHRCKLVALPVNFSAFFNDLAILKKNGHGLSELFCAVSSFW